MHSRATNAIPAARVPEFMRIAADHVRARQLVPILEDWRVARPAPDVVTPMTDKLNFSGEYKQKNAGWGLAKRGGRV
jgi:hypothetical protein